MPRCSSSSAKTKDIDIDFIIFFGFYISQFFIQQRKTFINFSFYSILKTTHSRTKKTIIFIIVGRSYTFYIDFDVFIRNFLCRLKTFSYIAVIIHVAVIFFVAMFFIIFCIFFSCLCIIFII